MELISLERIKSLLENKADRNELSLVSNSLSKKAEKADVDFISASLSNLRLDNEHRLLDLEKKLELYRSDLESFEDHFNNFDKKADARDLDRLMQLVSKKSDFEHVNSSLTKLRNELNEDINYVRDEIQQFKKHIGEEIGERNGKSKGVVEKLSDTVQSLSEQMRTIVQERRHDLEETTSIAKTISNNAKKELQLTTDALTEDIGRFKRDVEELLAKKLDKKEWSQAKSKLQAVVENKVDLAEVQNTVDIWQNELNLRLSENREEIKGLIKENEKDIFNSLLKKANLSDLANKLEVMQSLLNKKVDIQELESLKQKVTKLIEGTISTKGEKNILLF